MEPIRVQRLRTKGFKLPENTVCVTRGTKWGNPFKIGMEINGTHLNNDLIPTVLIDNKLCVLAYRFWLDNTIDGDNIKECAKVELKGKNLACFCSLDEACHADVLLKLANEQIQKH